MRALLPGMLLLGASPLAFADCAVNVVGLSFSPYDTLTDLDNDITGSVEVSCDVETSVEISLSTGFGAYTARRMNSGAGNLFYNLFVDPSRLLVWGDGSPGTSALSLSGTEGHFPVYGRIPARQNVTVGSYSDTITVTLTY